MSSLVPRHYDYVFQIPTIAAGGVLTGFPLTLDPDAPFVLRGRALRNRYNALYVEAGMQWLNMRFTDGHGNYRQQAPVPQTLVGPFYGQQGAFIPEWPNIVYPAGGTIKVDLVNTGTSALTNLHLFFRGVKLYPPGVSTGYTYPPKFAGLNYIYPVTVSQLGVTETRRNQIFTVKPDADFVIRGGSASTVGAASTFEVFMTLKDWNGKAYSNGPIHTDVLFGGSGGQYPVGAVWMAPLGIQTGAMTPGLLYPEIYLPAKQQLYYDISRADSSHAGAAAADFMFRLVGQKVFKR